MEIEFTNELIYWRGPAPFHFVVLPPEPCAEIRAVSAKVSYGWGVIPVMARIGRTEFKTSLFPKNGEYLLPVKDAVRRAEQLEIGMRVKARIEIEL